jgi:hypothetical protein
MHSLHRFARQRITQFALAFVAAGSWLSACGDDGDDGGGDGNSGGSSGSAGSGTGGATGGSGGSPKGGSAGMPTGGSAGAPIGGSGGSTAGSAGSAGTGAGGEGMGGEGGDAMGGEGGVGVGGEGGSTDAMCTTANLSVMLVSADPMQAHTHLPINGAARVTLLGMINSGSPLVFTLPTAGTNPHNHTLTFTAPQLTVLRNGGALAMDVTSAMGGPAGNMHTHTYEIECEP